MRKSALCPVCGNEEQTTSLLCRFCGADLAEMEQDTARPPFVLHKTVNLEQGRPLVETALKRLSNELALAKSQNVRVLTLIHGYGSSGKGGSIRIECRKMLDHLLQQSSLKSRINGEDFQLRTGAGKALIRRFPGLEKSCHSDFRNPGVTIAVLS